MVSVTLSYDEELKQWSAWVRDVAAFGVGGTVEEAVSDLKEALSLYIEVAGKKQFLQELAPPSQSISIPLASLV